MVLNEKQRKEFEAITKPLIKWLNDNCHPESHQYRLYHRLYNLKGSKK